MVFDYIFFYFVRVKALYYHNDHWKFANAVYVMILFQTPSGVPMAVRMQASVRFFADQNVTPEAQGNQPQIDLLSDSSNREMNGLT